MWQSFIATWVIFYQKGLNVSHKKWCSGLVVYLIRSPLRCGIKVGKWWTKDTTLNMDSSTPKSLWIRFLTNKKNIGLIGSNSSHQNVIAECSIKTAVTITWTTLMHAALRCPKDTLSNDFGQWKLTIIYGFTIVYLMYRIIYRLLRNVPEQRLKKYRNL